MFETDSGCYSIALKKRHAAASDLGGVVRLEDSAHGYLFLSHSLLRIPTKTYTIQELQCSSSLVIFHLIACPSHRLNSVCHFSLPLRTRMSEEEPKLF